MKLDNSMLMYGIYNAETLEKLIKTVHRIHNTTTSSHGNCLQVNTIMPHLEYFMHTLGLQHYSTNSLLYLRIIKDKYVALYRELITQLNDYVSAIRVLVKGYFAQHLDKTSKIARNSNRS